MDVLSDILDVLKFKSCLYFTTKLGKNWGIEVPSFENVARFHYARHGQCYVRLVDNDQTVYLKEGDFIIIPYGTCHELKDETDSRILSLEKVLSSGIFDEAGSLVFGDIDQAEPINLVCGHFEFDALFHHPLLCQLPAMIHIRKHEIDANPWFAQALLLMGGEAGATKLGHVEILKRLSEILFIQAIRIWSGRSRGDVNFMAAMSDSKVGRSLQKFHDNPQERWTVEAMARQAGMSRTAFAEKFVILTDMTPIQYVTEWRVQKAQRLLIEHNASIEWVASQVGYESVAAFSRVFKKISGKGPGAYRRNHRVAVA